MAILSVRAGSKPPVEQIRGLCPTRNPPFEVLTLSTTPRASDVRRVIRRRLGRVTRAAPQSEGGNRIADLTNDTFHPGWARGFPGAVEGRLHYHPGRTRALLIWYRLDGVAARSPSWNHPSTGRQVPAATCAGSHGLCTHKRFARSTPTVHLVLAATVSTRSGTDPEGLAFAVTGDRPGDHVAERRRLKMRPRPATRWTAAADRGSTGRSKTRRHRGGCFRFSGQACSSTESSTTDGASLAWSPS